MFDLVKVREGICKLLTPALTNAGTMDQSVPAITRTANTQAREHLPPEHANTLVYTALNLEFQLHYHSI